MSLYPIPFIQPLDLMLTTYILAAFTFLHLISASKDKSLIVWKLTRDETQYGIP